MRHASEDEAELVAGRVVVVDDDHDLLAAQAQGLELAGFQVLACSAGEEALRELSPEYDGAVLSDVRMPRMDGITLLDQIQAIDAEIPVILLTGHGDVPMAVQALKNGAYDFLTKPFPMDKLVASLRQAAQKRRLIMENRQLRQLYANTREGQKLLLGDSPVMIRLRETLAQIADADVDVLITGDTGTGKEGAARTLHRMSERRTKPFVHINCASLPEESFHVSLFGAEPSARAGHGLQRRVVGSLERANRGFVLLDGVDALSLSQQARLLNAIEAREIWPQGAEDPRPLDIRIIATTKRDLRASVADGQFRDDLFYRLSGVTIHIPPLCQRRRDVALLFQHFVVRSCARLGRPIPRVTDAVQNRLQLHDWPGNVRELEHFAERFTLGLEQALTLDADQVGEASLAARVSRFEADLIRQTLTSHRGSAQASALALGLARKTFYDKLARHGIDISAYRTGRRAEV